MRTIKKLIFSTMLILMGFIVGCGVKTPDNTVHADNLNYKEESLGRITVITYIDETNGNVVYISYDTFNSQNNRLQSVGMTSQPLKNK